MSQHHTTATTDTAADTTQVVRGDSSLSTFHTYFGTEYADYNFGQAVASAYGMTVPEFNRHTACSENQNVLVSVYRNTESLLSLDPTGVIATAIVKAVKQATIPVAFTEEAHIKAGDSLDTELRQTFADNYLSYSAAQGAGARDGEAPNAEREA